MSADNVDHSISDSDGAGKTYHNQLVLNNVLAGRVPLFNYDTNFATSFKEKNYSGTYAPIYPNNTNNKQIYKIKTEVEIPIEAVEGTNILKLTENEVIQFRAPSFKTINTYPAYVNYYLHLDKEGKNYVQAIPATMQSLRDFLRGGPNATNTISKETLEYYINNTNFPANLIEPLEISEDIRNNEGKFKEQFDSIVSSNCAIFVKPGTTYQYVQDSASGLAKINEDANTIFYTLLFDKSGISENGVIA
jgi:hypothetical protein